MSKRERTFGLVAVISNVLVVDFLSDPVDPFQCLETAAVAAQEETVVLVAVVQVLQEEQEEVHEVP